MRGHKESDKIIIGAVESKLLPGGVMQKPSKRFLYFMTAVICCLCFASSASAADASAAVEYYKGTGIAVLKKAGQNSEIPKNTTGWMRDQADWYYATGSGTSVMTAETLTAEKNPSPR